MLRGLNENHNHDLKNIFKAAATKASSCAGPFQDFYEGLLTKGMKPSMARLTLARKIAAVTLIIWKKGARATPSRWLYEPETLSERSIAVGRRPHFESQAQHDSAAKAACSLERLCPIKERGSGIGDCDDGGGVVLKRKGPTPLERLCIGFADRAEPC
jgi:hypothetical protein